MSNSIKTSLLVWLSFGLLLVCQDINAQTQEQLVTINVKNASLKQVFNAIEKQTTYRFSYRDVVVDNRKDISISMEKVPVSEVLTKALAGRNLEYSIVSARSIVISDKNPKPANQVPVSTQTRKTVSGKITDETGEPVMGATILEKGTQNNGTASDADGNFTLNVGNNATLVVSYIGYATNEYLTNNQTSVNIILSEDSKALEEVVVIGYGTQKKVNLAGAVETINSKTLESRSTSNAALALQGIVSNLTITPTSGQASDEPEFNIRGTTSINGGSPLILVDGIPTSAGDFGRINTADIDNISVLKDASSAAIYGARASFGVILVTTKKGQGEKLTVRFNNNFNMKKLTRRVEVVMDPYVNVYWHNIMGKPWYNEYANVMDYAKQLSEDPSLPSIIVDPDNPNAYMYLQMTDWMDVLYDDFSPSRSHNLSISGANQKVSYYLGTEYYREDGLMKINRDVMQRYNARSRVEYKPVDWLTIGNNTNLSYYNYKKPTLLNNTILGYIQGLIKWIIPPYNPDGSYTSNGLEFVASMLAGDSKTDNTNVTSQFNVDLELVKNTLNIKSDFTARLINSRTDAFLTDANFIARGGPNDPGSIPGWGSYANSTTLNTLYTQFNLYGNFHKAIGLHDVSAIAGFSQEYERSSTFYGQRRDLITPSYTTVQLATGDQTLTESRSAWAIRSGFYRLNYIYGSKYIVGTNGRYDGTSRFPKANRFGLFPSAEIAWIASGEQFFEPLQKAVNYLKFRVTYGSLGNQAVGDYPYIATMTAAKQTAILGGVQDMGVNPPGLISAVLTWEKVYTLNGGLDANFLNNRLSTSLDIYRRDTKDMLTKGRTLPNTLGTSEPQINAADLRTSGWELSIGWRDRYMIKSKPLNLSTRFILYDSKTVITKFDNPTGNLSDYYVGQELGEIWGLTTLGFFKDQADIDNSADQWAVTSYPGDRPIEPGDLKYEDTNNDGKITRGDYTLENPGDLKIIGNSSNRFNYGLDINLDWNNFDLRVMLHGVGKKDWYPSNASYKFFGAYYSPRVPVLVSNLDHWTPENPDGYFPRMKSYIAWESNKEVRIPQTRYLQNAAYMRMKNITFGYTLPSKLLSGVKMQAVRLYLSGENLFEITKLQKYFDPEALNQTTYPFMRTYSVGLNITL
ncbi:MAG: TonB-dependent receptor [Tannerella sp.]|jgi:TonB-linked SusC/RagA family outer membrane protein|nr:TonB-dependent receptor [Tannerella sp.]